LSPREYSKFLSYVTGWLSVIAWQAATASAAWLNAGIIEAIAILNYPNYTPKPFHGVLIFYAVIAVALLMNTYFGRIFPKFEALALFLHIAGFFAILIVLVYLSPKASPSDVFHTFINGGGFSTYGQAFMQGSVAFMFAFLGIYARILLFQCSLILNDL
jgi:choline transport protein